MKALGWNITRLCDCGIQVLGRKGDGGEGNITPLLLWKPNPLHHREEMCQNPGQPGCSSHHKADHQPPPPLLTSPLSPKTLKEFRGLQKWRFMKLLQCSNNLPGEIYQGLSLRNATGFLVIIYRYRNVRIFLLPLNQGDHLCFTSPSGAFSTAEGGWEIPAGEFILEQGSWVQVI